MDISRDSHQLKSIEILTAYMVLKHLVQHFSSTWVHNVSSKLKIKFKTD